MGDAERAVIRHDQALAARAAVAMRRCVKTGQFCWHFTCSPSTDACPAVSAVGVPLRKTGEGGRKRAWSPIAPNRDTLAGRERC
jgi:hypothetical protein